MKYLTLVTLLIFLVNCGTPPDQEIPVPVPASGPIQLHPENPHYFLYKGKATALITSAEHYGAVLNLDFNYKTYLEALTANGMNYTRIFTGSYFEIPGESFSIQYNTLAPDEGRVITPWKQVRDDSGHLKYDLSQWNPDYFDRLVAFVELAESLGVVVEVTLFSSIYRDQHWDISPQNPENNVNISHAIDRKDAQTLNNGELQEYQEALVRKLVQELNEFDNIFFEIQNEPWADRPLAVYNIVNKEELNPGDWTFKADFGDQAAIDWHDRLIGLIVEEEAKLEKKHLIAQNYTNFKAPIPYVNPHISIINFHYAWPEAAEWNYHYDKVIGFDESGFAGSGDQVYRRQAWRFMFSGGGLFNNLDYSFYVGAEDGTGTNSAPGGGSTVLRKQLKILGDFLQGFELEKLQPDQVSVLSSPGLIPYVLSDKQDTYAIYLRAIGTEQAELDLNTGAGSFQVVMLDPLTGTYSEHGTMEAKDGVLNLALEVPKGEMALKISRR